MDKLLNQFNEKVKEVDEMVKESDVAMAEMRLQFATLVRMQADERIEMQKLHNEEHIEMRKAHEKVVAHWKHVCIGLILTICLLIGGFIGGAIYILSNYDFAVVDQVSSIGNDGDIIFNDGIHYNSNRGG